MLTCFKIHSTGLYTLQHIFTCLRVVTGQRSKVKGQRSKVKGQRSKVKGQKVKGQIIRLKPLKCKFFQFRTVYTIQIKKSTNI